MSRFKSKVPFGSVFLAPMEGVTDDNYRNVVFDHFGGWDFYACDFLRIPSVGHMPKRLIKSHIGEQTLNRKDLFDKTYLQVLASRKSNIEETIESIKEFGITWLDLNLGCPSKKVNGHRGGAYLLEDLEGMVEVVSKIRKCFPDMFTAKIRVGYKDDKNFFEILKILEDLGVEAITIHGRTKEQMYKGQANWEYIKKAVEVSNLPIIGNGDVFKPVDIKNMLTLTGCHGVMVARGALQNPWIAKLYKSHLSHLQEISSDADFIEAYKIPKVKTYFDELNETIDASDERKLKRFKGLSKYVVADLEEKSTIQSQLLRSQDLNNFMRHIHSL